MAEMTHELPPQCVTQYRRRNLIRPSVTGVTKARYLRFLGAFPYAVAESG